MPLNPHRAVNGQVFDDPDIGIILYIIAINATVPHFFDVFGLKYFNAPAVKDPQMVTADIFAVGAEIIIDTVVVGRYGIGYP